MMCMWDDGIFSGVKAKTGEVVVGDCVDIRKTRTVKRTPKSERWNVESVEIMSGAPWNVSPEDKKASGEMPKVIKLSENEIEKCAGVMKCLEPMSRLVADSGILLYMGCSTYGVPLYNESPI